MLNASTIGRLQTRAVVVVSIFKSVFYEWMRWIFSLKVRNKLLPLWYFQQIRRATRMWKHRSYRTDLFSVHVKETVHVSSFSTHSCVFNSFYTTTEVRQAQHWLAGNTHCWFLCLFIGCDDSRRYNLNAWCLCCIIALKRFFSGFRLISLVFFVARPTCQTHNHTQTDFFTQETAASIHSQGGEEKVWMTGASRGTTDWDFKSLTGTELISNLIQLQ